MEPILIYATLAALALFPMIALALSLRKRKHARPDARTDERMLFSVPLCIGFSALGAFAVLAVFVLTAVRSGHQPAFAPYAMIIGELWGLMFGGQALDSWHDWRRERAERRELLRKITILANKPPCGPAQS